MSADGDGAAVPSVVAFDDPIAAGSDATALLGGKGAALAEMSRELGLPVPPGFIVTTEVCRGYLEHGWPEGLDEQIATHIELLAEQLGRRLGDPDAPLLVSVRSGAPISMPGMMDTLLNVGMTEQIRERLAHEANPAFAADTWLRFCRMYAEVVLGVPRDAIEQAAGELSGGDDAAGAAELLASAEGVRRLAAEHEGGGIPTDERCTPTRQVAAAARRHRPATHRVGSVDPDEVEHARREIHELHVAGTLRGRRAQETAGHTGCVERYHRERLTITRRRGRAHDEHGVALQVDPTQQHRNQVIGPAQRVGSHGRPRLGGLTRGGRVGTHDVGTLDEHDRSVGPDLVEGAPHGIGREPHAERRGGVAPQEVGVHSTGLHHTGRVHERGRGLAVIRRRHDRLDQLGRIEVGVGDHRARETLFDQRAGQHADLSLPATGRVRGANACDPEVHDPSADRVAGPAAERLGGGSVAQGCVDPECLACVQRPRADRLVPGAERGVTADKIGAQRRCTGGEVGEGALSEQLGEVRREICVDVAPSHARERDDQDPADGRVGSRRWVNRPNRVRESGHEGSGHTGHSEGHRRRTAPVRPAPSDRHDSGGQSKIPRDPARRERGEAQSMIVNRG